MRASLGGATGSKLGNVVALDAVSVAGRGAWIGGEPVETASGVAGGGELDGGGALASGGELGWGVELGREVAAVPSSTGANWVTDSAKATRGAKATEANNQYFPADFMG